MFQVISLFLSVILMADVQPDYPVTWHIASASTGEQSHQLTIEAYIQEGWVIYGMHTSEDGPIPTSFDYEPPETIELVGSTIEKVPAEAKFEPLFDMEVLKFSQKAVFLQNLNQLGTENVVKGNIRYMACDGTKCLPPTDVPFIALLK